MADRILDYRGAIREALREEMSRDESVLILGEDVGVWGNLFGCTKGLIEEFGKERVRDTPISEAAIAGCAIGCAALGLRPVAEIMYIDFATIAMDQIVNHGAKWHQLSRGKIKVPVVFRTMQGVGRRNSSQHSQTFENWFVNVPGLVVLTPATPHDAKGLLKSAIRDDNPVIFIEHKALYNVKGPVSPEDYTIPIGSADIKRAGRDVTIVANSWMVTHALNAAESLSKEGIDCEIVDLRTLYPLDEDSICSSVRKTGRCLTVNEAPAYGGFSGEVAAIVSERCFSDLKTPVKRLTGVRTGIPYGKDLEWRVVPCASQIEIAVRDLVGAETPKVKA